MSKIPELEDFIKGIGTHQQVYPSQSHINYYWESLIQAYENNETACSWCCLDYIGTITHKELIPFFCKLAYSGRDWYSRELAIHWLKNNYPDVINHREFSHISLELLNHYSDEDMQRVALTGIKYFGTDDAKAKVWQMVYSQTESSGIEQYRKFKQLAKIILKDPDYDLTRHIIITPPTNNGFYNK